MEQRRDGPTSATTHVGKRRVQHAARSHLGRPDRITTERLLLLPDIDLFCLVSGFGAAPGLSVCAAADPLRDHLESVARQHRAGLPPALAERTLVDAIQHGHQGARKLAAMAGPDQQFGATVAAVLLLPDRALVAHVGADRVYRSRDGRLEQLTVDHSLLNDYLQAFNGPAHEVERIKREFPYKGVIVRALGVTEQVLVEVREHPLAPGDRLAIVTRELGDDIGPEGIAAALADDDADVIADSLMVYAASAEPLRNYAAVVLTVD